MTGSWLAVAVILALVFLVVVITAAFEWWQRRDMPAPRPHVEGTLPIIGDCLGCRLAREAGPRHHRRHLDRDHTWEVMGRPT